MKKKFSINWIGSKKPRKQRKYRANAPTHRRKKMLSSNLSKELRKKYNRRNFPLRKGDNVLVMRGKFKKRKGKISSINLKKLKVAIEGLQTSKKDGTKVNVVFDPSNLQIIELIMEDKKRIASIKRGKDIEEKSEQSKVDNKLNDKEKKE